MVSKKRATELALKYLYGQQKMFNNETNSYAFDANEIQEVLIDLGPERQAFFLVYPDEQIELIFLGEHDAIGL